MLMAMLTVWAGRTLRCWEVWRECCCCPCKSSIANIIHFRIIVYLLSLHFFCFIFSKYVADSRDWVPELEIRIRIIATWIRVRENSGSGSMKIICTHLHPKYCAYIYEIQNQSVFFFFKMNSITINSEVRLGGWLDWGWEGGGWGSYYPAYSDWEKNLYFQLFFRHSNLFRPLLNRLKYLWIWFWFCRGIRS